MLASVRSYSQFYNGSQMTFGKNRVQFDERFWSYLKFKKFNVYYYKEGKELAVYTALYAEKAINESGLKLDYSLETNIQFIVFNKYSDLKQSNIGLIESDLYNTGGVTHIVGSKVFLYFDGVHHNLEEQIKYGVASIMLNELIYGESYFSNIKNTMLINFPEWYQAGLLNYISQDWNADIDNKVKDGTLSGKYLKFNHLEGEDAINAGHSIWKYIEIKYGASNIPNIIYMSKVNKNVESGFLFALGIPFKTLIKDWHDYYLNYRYLPISNETASPGKEDVIKKSKKNKVYQQLKLSSDGEYAAYTTNEMGQYKVWIHNISRHKTKKIMKRENRLDEKTDYSFPLLAWHPSGKILSIILESKGKTWLYFYNTENKNFEKRPIFLFEKILDFSYNDKGDKFVLSAVQKGHSDIYIYNIQSNTFEAITKDIYDDLNPRFINKSKDIIFSSNRTSDTLKHEATNEIDYYKKLAPKTDIFIYHYSKKSNVLERITNTANANETMPDAYDRDHVTYLSDENGIINRFAAKLDSSISFVDTTIHYRHFVRSFPVTNNLYNIIEQNTNTNIKKYSEIIYNKGAYKMYVKDIPDIKNVMPQTLKNYVLIVPQKKDETPIVINPEIDLKITAHHADTTYLNAPAKPRHKGFTGVTANPPAKKDTNKIDISNYKFQTQSSKPETQKQQIQDSTAAKSKARNKKFYIPRAKNADVEFNINEMVAQIGFSFLNTSYQPFTGGGSPIYINPPSSAYFQIGTTDLFEDYRIVGGARFGFDLVNNEYFISVSNLKKRLDKEFILHRNITVYSIANTYSVREHTDEALYILKYPFNQVLALKSTINLREDNFVLMSVDKPSLQASNIINYWSGVTAELIFDNTRNKGLNLYYGTRYKIFAQYLKQINGVKTDLYVVGWDYRHYIKISRSFIWANRFSGSTSLGKDKLLYYLGGVDSWENPSFDQTTEIATDQNYVFQTIATPMRGFNQNIRNGNSFALINSELRFPVFKYFIKHPIKSDFISNFQIIGFTDIGSAWTDWDPFSNKNLLFTHTFSDNPNIIVKVQNQSNPIVAGYGFGIRTKVLGYFIRLDWAWGDDSGVIQKIKTYLSFNLDF